MLGGETLTGSFHVKFGQALKKKCGKKVFGRWRHAPIGLKGDDEFGRRNHLEKNQITKTWKRNFTGKGSRASIFGKTPKEVENSGER